MSSYCYCLPFPQSSLAILLCPPSSTSHFHPEVISSAAHWIASLFLTLFCKPLRCLCRKIPVDQQILKYWDKPIWHQQPWWQKKHDYPCSCFRATTDVWTESKKTNKQTKNYRTTENTLSQKTLGSCWARAVLMSQYWKWLWLQHKIHGHHQPLNDQAHLNVSRPKLSCNTHKLYSANGNIEAWNRYWSICVPLFSPRYSV